MIFLPSIFYQNIANLRKIPYHKRTLMEHTTFMLGSIPRVRFCVCYYTKKYIAERNEEKMSILNKGHPEVRYV